MVPRLTRSVVRASAGVLCGCRAQLDIADRDVEHARLMMRSELRIRIRPFERTLLGRGDALAGLSERRIGRR